MDTPRMRTITKAISHIKQLDPDSAITESWLRKQIITGNLKCVKAGKRYLVDLNMLENYLSNPPANHSDASINSKIRRISER